MQQCLRPSRLQSVSFPPVVQFIFIFCWENCSAHVLGLSAASYYCGLLSSNSSALQMLPLCVVEICQKTGTRTENKKAIFSPKEMPQKPEGLCSSFHSIDWHLQRWNLNSMSGKDLISGTTKPFALSLWGYERWYSYCIQLSSDSGTSETFVCHHCEITATCAKR